MKKILVTMLMALAFTASFDCLAGKYSSGSSSYSRSSSSSSPSRSSYSSPSSSYKSAPSTPTPAASAPAASTRFSSPTSIYKGTGSALSTTPAPRVGGSSWFHHDDDRPSTVVHEHYYNNGGGFASSPFFWMWMFDRQQAQPVVIQNGGAPNVGGATGSYAEPVTQPQDDTPFWLKCLNVLFGLGILAVGGGIIWWIVRWVINRNK